ncbi:MAG: type II toxin-antitoxin system HicA family toxin [Planctomycetota bacterium]|nr:type II toxin-antitoxin system HicA family toxin [Planctomycetota bacterium]
MSGAPKPPRDPVVGRTLKHLGRHGCPILREGGRHTVVWNPRTRQTSTVPRHREVNEFTARKICQDLGIPEF